MILVPCVNAIIVERQVSSGIFGNSIKKERTKVVLCFRRVQGQITVYLALVLQSLVLQQRPEDILLLLHMKSILRV